MQPQRPSSFKLTWIGNHFVIETILSASRWKLTLLSGILIGLAFPPLKLGFVAWFGLVPLLTVFSRSSPTEGMLFGYLAGVASNLIAVHWLTFNVGETLPVVFASMVAAVVYLSLFWSLIGFLVTLIHVRTGKGLLLAPFIWTAVDYAMNFGPLGFPWVSPATTQADYLPLIQMAEFTGIHGITFWLVLLNVLTFRICRFPARLRLQMGKGTLVLLVLPWLLGYGLIAKWRSATGPQIRIALVQSNVGPHEKWDPERRNWVFDHLDLLYKVATETDPQLIVWPESATPTYLSKNQKRLRRVKKRVIESGIPLLTGSIDWGREAGERVSYNSAIMIDGGDSIATYHKIQLVPLAESSLFPKWVSFAEKLSLGNFTPGDRHTLFHLEDVPFATIICFESAFPRLVNKFVSAGARFLVVVVNDGWYGNTAEPYQHAALARIRAVEHRMAVARCANTGISAFYDASGQMTSRLEVGEEGIITAGISPRSVLTFYGRHGDLFTHSILVIFVLLGLWFWHREK